MVKLEEVLDEEYTRAQVGPEADEEWDTDSESEVDSDDEDITLAEETFAERIAALKDIVPPTQRKFLSNTVDTASSWISSTLRFSGQSLWVISTSALLLGVPWALAFAEEQQLAEMEREMKMQQGANELLTAGIQPQQGASPAL